MLFICYKFNQQIAVFFIQGGQTALFYAVNDCSKCEDDEVKDIILHYLVIEKGIDINSVNKVAFTIFRIFVWLFYFSLEGHPYCTHWVSIILPLSSLFRN